MSGSDNDDNNDDLQYATLLKAVREAGGPHFHSVIKVMEAFSKARADSFAATAS